MEEYYCSRKQVPAFGSWDWNNDLPFTECFESARQAGLLRYSYSDDRDLYTPAMIVVPHRKEKVRQHKVKEEKNWVRAPSSPTSRPIPKPVDEDLYKISPELLYAKSKKKRGMGFFSSCLMPTCLI